MQRAMSRAQRLRIAVATIGACGLLAVSMSGCQVQTSDAVAPAPLPAQTLPLAEPPPTAAPAPLEFPEEPKPAKAPKSSKNGSSSGSDGSGGSNGAQAGGEAPPPQSQANPATPSTPKPSKPKGKPACSGVQQYLYTDAKVRVDSAKLTIEKANKAIADAKKSLEIAVRKDNAAGIQNATLRIKQWQLLKGPAVFDRDVQQKMINKIEQICKP